MINQMIESLKNVVTIAKMCPADLKKNMELFNILPFLFKNGKTNLIQIS